MIGGKKTIGIVGGVGPYAGLDLNRKIFDNTVAANDQDHLSVVMISASALITDRTRYLLQHDVENPAKSLFKVIAKLDDLGATAAGMPCNTAHAEPIFSALTRLMSEGALKIRLLNMIAEVMAVLKAGHLARRVGVLSTLGTYRTGLYASYLNQAGIPAVFPDDELARSVHTAIYHPAYGIKARSNPVSSKARTLVATAVRKLAEQGADTIILGCTELPLARPSDGIDGIRLVDPATILARALIRHVDPQKLKATTPDSHGIEKGPAR